MNRPWYVSAGLALAAVALVLGFAWAFTRVRSPFPFFGTAYHNPITAPVFSGTDDLGKPYTFKAGRTTALFFGFTHCPNICPLTLKYLSVAKTKLTPEQQKNFDIVFVSVDPERDNPKLLHDYVEFFGGGTGVNIPEPELSRVAQEYGVGYRKSEVKGLDYQIDHTTATYLIDSSGKLRVLWDYTQMPQVDRVLSDIQHVMEHPSQ